MAAIFKLSEMSNSEIIVQNNTKINIHVTLTFEKCPILGFVFMKQIVVTNEIENVNIAKSTRHTETHVKILDFITKNKNLGEIKYI